MIVITTKFINVIAVVDVSHGKAKIHYCVVFGPAASFRKSLMIYCGPTSTLLVLLYADYNNKQAYFVCRLPKYVFEQFRVLT